MEKCGSRSISVAFLVIGVLVVAISVQGAMKITSATIPMPTDDKITMLAGLEYGVGWKAEITSIRLDPKTVGEGDPMRPVWVVTGSSSRPQLQKVNLQITLLDSDGNPVGTVKKFLILKVASVNVEYPIKMKIKAAAWEQATQVRIRATFMVA